MEPDDSAKPIVNKPEADLSIQPLTLAEIEAAAKKRVSRIDKEFKEGFEFIKNQPKSVSFFGSSRMKKESIHYGQAVKLAARLATLGYSVLTGAGPGIMEAANRGAKEAGGRSVGLSIKLPQAQVQNAYVTEKAEFYYFFTRKVMLSFAAEAYIFFPGGFGTLDEFFEIVTLVQTNKIEPVPIICVGTDFWNKLNDFIYNEMYKKHDAIVQSDLRLYHITDNEDEVVEIVSKVPIRNGVRYFTQ